MVQAALRLDTRNPYLQGAYAPTGEEVERECRVIAGAIPADLDGLLVRNGPNPHFAPEGRYHWFDGDGMVHAVRFRDGRAHYRNRWVSTRAFAEEQAAGRALWRGIMEGPNRARRDMPLKDTANTDIIFHHGKLLALWYLSGQPYALDPATLATLGADDFGGTLKTHVSAHAKVDYQTNELMFFDYGPVKPYMTYGVVDPGGRLVHQVPIDLPAARLPHDMAITENYSILLDLPLYNDMAALKAGRWRVIFDRELPARFGILPRRGGAQDVRWFEASPCYVYHTTNAWEDGDEIVLLACRYADPWPEANNQLPDDLARMMATLRLDTRHHVWRFNLKTGACREQTIDPDRNTEFPSINLNVRGRRSRYCYNVSIKDSPTLLFDGLVKYDERGGASRHDFGPGRFGSESPFAPRASNRQEDDGYVVSFVYDADADRSEAVVIDAQDFTKPPVARIELPQRVPLGFHATWVEGRHLPRG
ncbi:MAG: 9-cis-epoxycarotenoid dioxygenase [Alphaproteobacteria bacterium]|nr:9-cis-epoxycarotenoid dioxygenase [Alphaproteobacteria bacterium]